MASQQRQLQSNKRITGNYRRNYLLVEYLHASADDFLLLRDGINRLTRIKGNC